MLSVNVHLRAIQQASTAQDLPYVPEEPPHRPELLVQTRAFLLYQKAHCGAPYSPIWILYSQSLWASGTQVYAWSVVSRRTPKDSQ